MAFIVRRPGGRWEIRESYASEDGPRSRTLVSFTRLSAEVLKRAEAAAHTPFDRSAVVRSARRAGTGLAPSAGDELATNLLRLSSAEHAVRPGIRRLLVDRLSRDLPRLADDSIADWVGASDGERGAALIDLLGLTDRLPKPTQRKALEFPGLSRQRLRRR